MLLRKIFKVDMAHRLMGSYTKKCQNIHGHSFKIEIFLHGQHLNECGMVIDFNKLKDKVKPFINKFDHSLMVSHKDPIVPYIKDLTGRYIITPFNPTSENMSIYLYDMIASLIREFDDKQITLKKIRIHETETAYAEYDGNSDLLSTKDWSNEDILFSSELSF